MQELIPSRSALRVALRRAAHQLYDQQPLVFEDPLAVPILGAHAAQLQRTPGRGMGRRPGVRVRTHSFSLRAFLVARSRYAEDQLASAYTQGIRQYVVLGAGLDTFAYRNPYPDLRVIEADQPATQAWKRELLAAAGLLARDQVNYASLNVEKDDVGGALARAGLDSRRGAFFACLGLVPYLSPAAFHTVLSFVATQPAGSAAVFDYIQPRHEHTGFDQLAHDSISERLQALGEPLRLHLSPAALHARAAELGLMVTEDLGADELNARYFLGRSDELAVLPSAGRQISLHVSTPGECAAVARNRRDPSIL